MAFEPDQVIPPGEATCLGRISRAWGGTLSCPALSPAPDRARPRYDIPMYRGVALRYSHLHARAKVTFVDRSRLTLVEIQILFDLVDQTGRQFFAAAVHRGLRTSAVADHAQMTAPAPASLDGCNLAWPAASATRAPSSMQHECQVSFVPRQVSELPTPPSVVRRARRA